MARYTFVSTCLLLSFVHINPNGADNVTGVTNIQSVLIRDLLRNYDPLVRPVVDPATVVEVKHGMSINQIIQMDEINQQVSVAVHLRQGWNDEYLRWDPANYAGVTDVRIPRDLIWIPDIYLYNSVDKDFGTSTAGSNVIVKYDGTVKLYGQALFTSSCSFDILYIPFDVQNCNMVFASWTHNESLLFLTNGSTGAWLDNYYQNNEWELVDAPVETATRTLRCCDFSVAELKYTLILRRQPFFHFIFVIIPFVLMSCVSLLVFQLPAESGEKLALCITNLLALIIFYDSIGAALPATSDNKFPLIGMYFFSQTSVAVLSCVATVIVLKMHHMRVDDRPVPRWLHKVVFGRFGLNCLVWHLRVPRTERKRTTRATNGAFTVDSRRASRNFHVFENGAPSVPDTESTQDGCPDDEGEFAVVAMQRDLAEILWNVRRLNEMDSITHTVKEVEEESVRATWKNVAEAFDRFFFLLFGFYFLVNTSIVFLSVKHLLW